jgi:hypothetical protein
MEGREPPPPKDWTDPRRNKSGGDPSGSADAKPGASIGTPAELH